MKCYKLILLFSLPLLSFILACEQSATNVNPIDSGPFMNMTATHEPVLLAPAILASSLDEYNGTFTPDGKEFYFTTNTPQSGIITYTMLKEDNTWSQPKVAPFSGVYSEYDPLFSVDGSRLYFSSERPLEGSDASGETNIWYVERKGSEWSEPIYVDLEEGGNYYSSLTSEGDVCFNRWKDGDIYIARKSQDGYTIEKLPAPVNSQNDEGDPFISPDGSYIIFRAYNNGFGRGDLFITYNIDGDWTEPENLGEPINSAAHEICPYVTVDGKFLIFASGRMDQDYLSMPDTTIDAVRDQHQDYNNGGLNIYYISADFIEKGRKKHMLSSQSN